MSLENIISVGGILVPVLCGGFGAYISLVKKIERIEVLVGEFEKDISRLALMIPTKRALCEDEEEDGGE